MNNSKTPQAKIAFYSTISASASEQIGTQTPLTISYQQAWVDLRQFQVKLGYTLNGLYINNYLYIINTLIISNSLIIKAMLIILDNFNDLFYNKSKLC